MNLRFYNRNVPLEFGNHPSWPEFFEKEYEGKIKTFVRKNKIFPGSGYIVTVCNSLSKRIWKFG